MIFGLVTSITIFLLFYKLLSTQILIMISGVVFATFYFTKNDSNQVYNIDFVSRGAKIAGRLSVLKFCVSISSIILSIVLVNNYLRIAVFLFSSIFIVIFGGIKLKTYLGFLKLPTSFIILGVLAIIIGFSDVDKGFISINIGRYFVFIDEVSQSLGREVFIKSISAFSGLYILSLTTPIPQIIHILKKLHLPEILISLFFLIYRYIFIIFEMSVVMKTSSISRLGFIDYKKSIMTTARIYSLALFRSYKRASDVFDSIEARCFSGKIDFLEEVKDWKKS